MQRTIRFSEIEREVPADRPGIYEIHTDGGIALKVGISSDIRKRLLQHRASLDSGLKLKPDGNRGDPGCVEAKKSILAKHLYYDESIAPDFDLRTQTGRRAFLEQTCHIMFEVTESRATAADEERRREHTRAFRYVGRAVKR